MYTVVIFAELNKSIITLTNNKLDFSVQLVETIKTWKHFKVDKRIYYKS